MLLDLNPSAEAKLTLGDLGACLLADRVLATGAVVGRDLCVQTSVHWTRGCRREKDTNQADTEASWRDGESSGQKVNSRQKR